jgi:hypothetical protein
MTVTAAPGTVAVPLQSGQGCALCRWDANEVPTLAAGSAQMRIDLVIVQVRDNALDAGPNNDFIITSVTGVPAASNPAVPATPTNAAVLAQVLVPGGSVANLSTATVTDLRGVPVAPATGVLRNGYAQITADYVSVTPTTATAIPGLQLSNVVVPAGRRVRLSASLAFTPQTGSPPFNVHPLMRMDGAQIGGPLAVTVPVGNWLLVTPSTVVVPAAGVHSFDIAMSTDAGFNTWVKATPTAPAYVMAEDLGVN